MGVRPICQLGAGASFNQISKASRGRVMGGGGSSPGSVEAPC